MLLSSCVYYWTRSDLIMTHYFCVFHIQVNDKLHELYQIELLPKLRTSASCTKHGKGNAAKAAERGLKVTRTGQKELEQFGTTTSALTFLIRKFKPTSSYPHQKSFHLLAHIYQLYGEKGMLMMIWM